MTRYLGIAFSALALVACGNGSGSDADTGTTGTDGVDGTSGGCAAQAGNGYAEGEQMVDYELGACNKEKLKASDLLCGKKCLLSYFGAGWCAPCREKQPTLQKWYEKYGHEGLAIATILREDQGPDDPATSTFCQEWTDEFGLTFPVLTDPTDQYTGKFLGGGGATFPVVVITSADFRIGVKDDGSADDLEFMIQSCLGL